MIAQSLNIFLNYLCFMIDDRNFEEIERLYMDWEEFERLEKERDGLVEYDLMEKLSGSGDITFLRDSKLLGELEGVFYFNPTQCISVLGEEFLVKGHVRGFKLVGGNSSARRVFKPGSYWKSRSSEDRLGGGKERYKSVRYSVSTEVGDNGEFVVNEITDRKGAYRVLEDLVKPGYVVFVGIGDISDEEEGLMEFFEGSGENLERIYEDWREFRRLTNEFIVMNYGYNPEDYDYDPVDLYAKGVEEDGSLDMLLMYEQLEYRVLERDMRERLK